MLQFKSELYFDSIRINIKLLQDHYFRYSQGVPGFSLPNKAWEVFDEANQSPEMVQLQQYNLMYFNLCSSKVLWRAIKADNLMVVDRTWLVHALITLRDAEYYGCDYLSDMYAVDFMGNTRFYAGDQYYKTTGGIGILPYSCLYRFAVVYRVYNQTLTKSFMLVTFTEELVPIPSIRKIFSNAEYAEREAWEMVGVYFTGADIDLQRLISEFDFKWHPLRKDFPVTGYVECFYSYDRRGIEFVKVEFMQELRHYEFDDLWEQEELFTGEMDEESEEYYVYYDENVDSWANYSVVNDENISHPWIQDWGNRYEVSLSDSSQMNQFGGEQPQNSFKRNPFLDLARELREEVKRQEELSKANANANANANAARSSASFWKRTGDRIADKFRDLF